MKPLEELFEKLVESAATEAEKRIAERLDCHSLGQEKTMDIKEAAQYLHFSESTLRNLCRRKLIPHRVNGMPGSKNPRYLFSSVSLDKWKQEEERKNYLGETEQFQYK